MAGHKHWSVLKDRVARRRAAYKAEQELRAFADWLSRTLAEVRKQIAAMKRIRKR